MEWHQLRCFLAAADDLHFFFWPRGAAPAHAAVGARAPHPVVGGRSRERNSSLERRGRCPLPRTDPRLSARRVRCSIRSRPSKGGTARSDGLRKPGASGIGAMDSAAAGLLPPLMADVHAKDPGGYRYPVAGGKDDQAVAEDPFRRARSCVRSAAGAAGQAPRIQAAVFRKAPSWPFRRNIPLRGANPFR